jgi:hypothetical protein
MPWPMSLTILIHSKTRAVGIVRWFLDPNVSITYASGPVTEMPYQEFRAIGYEWVQRHFADYAKTRVCEKHVVQPFGQQDGKRFMADRDVLEIHKEPTGELRFVAAVVRQHNLGRGIEILEREKRRTTPLDSSPELFWRTFDEVLFFSHEYAI